MQARAYLHGRLAVYETAGGWRVVPNRFARFPFAGATLGPYPDADAAMVAAEALVRP